MKFRLPSLIISLLFLLVSANAESKNQPLLTELKLEFTNFRNMSDEALKAHINIQENQPYNATEIDQSVQSLYKTKQFEFISITVEDNANGNKTAVFHLTSKAKVNEVTFKGNKKVKSKKLAEEIATKPGSSVDSSQLKQDINKLTDFYQKKGYPKAKISYELDQDRETGITNVAFKIDEGKRVTIEKIRFTGNGPINARDLKKAMHTKTWNLLAFFTGDGNFRDDEFFDDLERLRDHCKNQGYLDVKITDKDVDLNYKNGSKLTITIHIELGKRYYVGAVKISNNKLFTSERLMKRLTLKSGEPFSPEKIEHNSDILRHLYGQVGYLETYAVAERIPNLEKGDIDVNFVVHESEKFYVESIKIEGNTKTKENVIVREIALAPGDVFDLVRMENSQAVLQNTRFFDEVNMMPEATNIPGRRNLRITVKEAKTASINFGVGYSSVEQFIAFAEFSQSNFDLFNYRNWFQGGGQKFRTRFSIGNRSNELIISFEEPYICERELAFGFELFNNESRYNSVKYDLLRTGAEVYLRKRLFELVEGRVFYHIEQVRISRIASDASPLIKSQRGYRSISKGGISLTRDTRNSFIYPTEGNRVEIGTELAGGAFGGQTKYYDFYLKGFQCFQLFETGEQVLSFRGRTSAIMGYGNQKVPFFEKLYMGGPDDMRGFGYHKIGPRDSAGEPVGGKTMAFASAEYTIKLFDPVRFAVFYDIGFLNKGELNWNATQYRDDWGVGLRVFLMGAPINIDLAFPINSGTDAKKGRPEFNFKFGANF